MRVAVVGHVEWALFAAVPRLPAQGEILHADPWWEDAAGGGSVAAVQLRKLAGEALFFTALGDDEIGERAARRLRELGVTVHAATRPAPTRRAFVHLDRDAERTITVMGERQVPHGDDALPWHELASADAVYFTGGDAGALRAARRAGTLVVTPRARGPLADGGVEIDALVHSGGDAGEAYRPGDIAPEPRYVVSTAGRRGGRFTGPDGAPGAWEAAVLPGEPRDAYGAGDSFAAGLTYALGAGMPIDEAVRLGARCGAHNICGRGPYEGQLVLAP